MTWREGSVPALQGSRFQSPLNSPFSEFFPPGGEGWIQPWVAQKAEPIGNSQGLLTLLESVILKNWRDKRSKAEREGQCENTLLIQRQGHAIDCSIFWDHPLIQGMYKL